jgi:transposase
MGARDRQLIVHSDNARPHTAKVVNEFLANNGMTVALHPPYSPDLTSYDFFLFSYIKNQLMRRSFDDTNQLWMAIKEVCESSKRAFLEQVSHEQRETSQMLCGGAGLLENT